MVDYAVEVSFTDLCRICANPCHSSRRITLFGAESTKLNLLEKIASYLPIITISENDGYPDFACILCVSKLTICDSLVNICKEANERLSALKAQLEYEKKSANFAQTENVDSEESNQNYSNENVMTVRAEVNEEGPFELHPDAESARITVILPKEELNPTNISEQSLVLVNVPSDRLQKAKENSISGKNEPTLMEKAIKCTADSEVSNVLRTLTSTNSLSTNDNLRRSSRPRTQKRFFETDGEQEAEVHTCSICEVTFNNLKKLHLHQRSKAHNVRACAKSMMCNKCRARFNSAEELESHECKPLICKFCNVIFENKKEQEQHSFLHDGPYTCDMCGATFSNLTILQNHIMCHTAGKGSKKLHQCKVCGKLFKSRLGLVNHESNHTDERVFTCYICSATFRNKEQMIEHRAQHTQEEKELQLGDKFRKNRQQPCSICNKVLASKAGLEVHMRMHKNEKPFECTECGKLFRQDIKLRYHLRIHMGELPYSCNVCNKRFNTQRQLDTHIRMHTNERPYICEVCGLGFRSSGVLGRHKYTHSEEPLFSCSVCGKKFRTRHTTTTHERTHTRDKGFICDLCGRTFAHKVTLEKHRQRHDKQRVSCVQCNISFASKKGLRRHFDKKHPVTLVRPVQIFEAVRSTDYVTLAVPNDELIVEVVV